MREVIGLLVTPQNTAPMPTAAHSGMEHPKAEAKKVPNVEPMKRVGTISPPLYPAPRVAAVKTIFNRKASGKTVFPSIHPVMIFMPVPLYV